MKLSIHPNIKGKPDKIERDDKPPLYKCDGSIVNLGYGWTNIEVDSWKDAFELITTDGYATSAELVDDHRTDDEYVSRQICMVDIDSGMTIQDLFNDDFYNEFGAGFYTTARHTDEAHRFRIMFVLEEPIYDYLIMRKIIRGLLEFYQTADRNCKDASRIYYGVKNCPIKECRDKILYKYITDELITMIDSIDSKPISHSYIPNTNKEYDVEFVDELLSRISVKTGTLHGEYDLFKTIAWAVCNTVGQHNANMLMSKYWSTKTKKEQQVIKTYDSVKSPTVGTLIKMSGISSTERQLLEISMKLRRLK
jgi:hypothetical protein